MLRDVVEFGGSLFVLGGLAWIGQWFYHVLVKRQKKFDSDSK